LTKVLRTRRRWTVTVDRTFGRVLDGCRAGRDPRWLTGGLIAVMTSLHRQGWCHSVEVWAGTELVGGLVGLGMGLVFSADTMFCRAGGASQIALVALAVRLTETPVTVLDLQWDSPHVRRLGAASISRPAYLELANASTRPVDLSTRATTVDDILGWLRARTADNT